MFAAPADGQSGFGTDGILLVRAPALAAPEDYPAPQAIRVVELATDGFVDGTVSTTQDGLLTFEPDQPWRANARYAWTVDTPDSLPHGPQFEQDSRIEGAAIFDTSDSLTALTAGRLDDQTCFILSRSIGADERSVLTVDFDDVAAEDAEFTQLEPEAWEPPLTGELSDADPGLSVVCTPSIDAAFARLYTSETNSSLVEISSDTPDLLVAALYRSAQ